MFGRSSKPQWHRIYYMLALFDVVVVLMGLYLTHQIISTFNDSVTINRMWEQRLDRYLALGEIAALVNAPGNDVFDTHEVDAEERRTQAALQIFQQQMAELRADAQHNLNAEQAAVLLGDLGVVDAAMREMVMEAERIFSFFRQDQTGLAGARMASMDRKYHALNQALAHVRKRVSAIQGSLFIEQQAEAASLQDFEFVIAGFVLVMITAAALYGHKIRQKLEAAEQEREHYLNGLQAAEGALQQANNELEKKVQARTTELANTNLNLQAEITERLRVEAELRQNELKLRFDAFHDKLTGLPNRAMLISQLNQALQRMFTDSSYNFALLFLDFDSFKAVNDSLGHWLGDEFLIVLARHLEKHLRQDDLVARFGGDEFVIFLSNVPDLNHAQSFATILQEQFGQPFLVAGNRLFTSASIGLVFNDGAYSSADEILRDADIAMYRAKATGKACVLTFDSSMRTHAMARVGMETELRDALQNKSFHLAYQPILDLKNQCISGFEALARWQHPQLGNIPPGDFIPLAEETGLILPLGEWVLEEACRQMKSWHSHYPQNPPLTISVNISACQFRQANLLSLITRILATTGFPAHYLKLEITESVFLEDMNTALHIFAELQALGIQLQLDDFGTGYSSLSYLHRLPIQALKIDQAFINRINLDDHTAEVVRAITVLAHTLQMNVIAEGVETKAQLHYIHQLGCEQAQGYLISKPMNPEEVKIFMGEILQHNKLCLRGNGGYAHFIADSPHCQVTQKGACILNSRREGDCLWTRIKPCYPLSQ